MSWPFLPRLLRPKPIDPQGIRIGGLTLDNRRPFFLPGPHTITYAPSGAGKSTCVAMPALMSFIASEPDKAVLVNDSKNAELCAQAVPMLLRAGRKVAIIDPFNTRPEFADLRIDLNPLGAAVSTYRRHPEDLLYVNEGIGLSLLEGPAVPDMRNFYWEESPRKILRYGISSTVARNETLATPGSVAALISDTDMLMTFAENDAEEGEPTLQTQADAVLEMRHHEHFAQHIGEAVRALRHFGPGQRLENVGQSATMSHEDLIRDGYVIFLCGPIALMNELGPFYALHVGAFTRALYQNIGSLRFIGDEISNTPLKSMLESTITTIRSFQGEYHLIAQSRSELIRKYGEQLTQTIEDNCASKQWLAFSSFEDAERVSKAMGEEHAVSTALGTDGGGLKTNTNLSIIKQRQMSPAELMSLPKGMQLNWVKGVGFFLSYTVAQNQIAPYGDWLAPNPMEGGKLPFDPVVRFTTSGRAK